MTINTKTPSQCADEYLLHLKALKPSINDRQEDSDWWIRSRVVGGVVSGVYSDQRKIAEDAFPQSARREAMERHLELYFGSGFQPATESVGFAKVTGASGFAVNPGAIQFSYLPNGNTYINSNESPIFLEGATGNAATGLIPVISTGLGQIQNLLEGAALKIASPPAGLNSDAVVFGGPLSDGRDEETVQEAAARVLQRIREPIRGGTSNDYEQWAIEADPAVVSANILRYPFGFGSVGVVISAGTTDIDSALDNNQPIVLVPSQQLIDTVAAYIETKRPLTDYVTVFSVVEEQIDVTVRVKFSQGDSSTILSGQTLTQAQLVEREVKRAIYKTPAGGRRLGASGFVVCSDIEEVIDLGLSSSPFAVGTLQILEDRQVDDLSVSGANRMVLSNQKPVPGTITVIEF